MASLCGCRESVVSVRRALGLVTRASAVEVCVGVGGGRLARVRVTKVAARVMLRGLRARGVRRVSVADWLGDGTLTVGE